MALRYPGIERPKVRETGEAGGRPAPPTLPSVTPGGLSMHQAELDLDRGGYGNRPAVFRQNLCDDL